MRIVVVIFLLSSVVSFGQREKTKNYSRYDNKKFHFGMMLGGSKSDFTLMEKTQIFEDYGVKSLTNQASAGGQFGPLVSMSLGTPVVRLRFMPSFSFQERVLNYVFDEVDPKTGGDLVNQERINSSNFDFPLMLQFRTIRLNNFATYVLTGIQYSWDMQSNADASQNFIDPFIKNKSHDWQAQLGGGVEFFFPYFKLGLEIKYAHGLMNAFIQDGTRISSPIDRLYSKTWSFSLIIEG